MILALTVPQRQIGAGVETLSSLLLPNNMLPHWLYDWIGIEILASPLLPVHMTGFG